MDFLKSVTGKVVSGLVVLGVIAAGISWWQMEPATRQMLLSGTGKIVAWFFVVLLVPWATFFLIRWVAGRDSNVAGAVLVMTYTLPEFVVLGYLFHWNIGGPTGWTFLILGGLFAGVYNLFTCDWIAEKLS